MKGYSLKRGSGRALSGPAGYNDHDAVLITLFITSFLKGSFDTKLLCDTSEVNRQIKGGRIRRALPAVATLFLKPGYNKRRPFCNKVLIKVRI